MMPGKGIAVTFLKQLFMSTTTTTMTTVEIANRLVDFCKKGDFEGAQEELFAEDAVSIEPHGTADFEKETHGLDAIKAKGKKWGAMVEENHGGEVSEPLMADSSFAVTMTMDVTMKGQGRMKMTELCIYHVKDGKIVSEQFLM
jgi:ketosteroid isomerase-like protein